MFFSCFLNDLFFVALHVAAERNYSNLVSLLLHFGADCRACTAKMETPLHLAARRKDTTCVNSLITWDKRAYPKGSKEQKEERERKKEQRKKEKEGT